MEDEEDAKREVDFTTMGSHDEMQPHRDENVEGRGIASSKMGELCDRRRHPSD
ncbi:hypothetical protein KIN20_009409 [Parelaphostrongylus tenuis]|uniref:Uncharacterized protein n=1 Tax=Parelaphostrongylus tenuis TaxID=148309 RepID=A0AAD5M6C2_PARTN|nr:hypothetical protein KIN20_009409 [Parelaphostrongylus tenuis]